MRDVSIALINPNANVQTTEMMVDIARNALPHFSSGPHVTITGHTAATGPDMIIDMDALSRSQDTVEAILRDLTHVEARRPDAVIISAYGDPGLDVAATLFPGRAFGIGTESFRAAADGRRRFAVATTTPGLVPGIAAIAERLGLEASYCGTYLTRTGPLELAADATRQRDELATAVETAIRDGGAEAVIIGGGPLAQAARELAPRLDVPLIEPIPTAVRAAIATLV